MKINLKSLLFWILPVLISFVFEFLFTDFRWFNLQNLIENLVLLFLIWLLLSFVQSPRLKRILTKILYSVFILFLAFETSFFYMFNTFFSASSLFIFFETNSAETKEFLNLYVDQKLVLYLLSMLSFISLFIVKPEQPAFYSKLNLKPVTRVALLVLLVLGLKISGFIIASFPFQLLRGSVSYIYETYKFSDLKLDQPLGHFENAEFKGDPTSHTFVLIIGESSARRQMGLYGYERETTPGLSQIKDELMIYEDVISSESYTIPSLQEALIFEDLESGTESSVIQLMNQAGFKTFWLSNQRPIGIYETFLTKLSKASDEYVYTNTTRWGSVTPLDEVLLPHLDKALADEAPKKFIVLNLLATHANYELRYPQAFDRFNSEPATPFPSEENFRIINQYHNSISYVDYMVSTIIDKVKAKQDKSYVLYFSDHGEEVFFDRDFVGHNASDIPTRSMFEIPFFVWTSTEFDSSYTIDFEAERSYILSDFIHSLSDLSQISFSKLDRQKSIFSEEYKVPKRIISGKLDFDVYFDNRNDTFK
ncbi:sulfatase-like hydrolase/transferase [Psychroflexus sediminis]|uniref:Heptose-I-phosphate ethanolaminephosphotransferase n=1 Tax=Psychroflexus sediminis TaxID=470826 RepID=A0A1G7VCT0_9FLAO|nr:sulfatase-like hydrolase/transferase [Psychroflexus sediminis]SDG57616.1 heptose-I-phosphate ethanolaminephosphotransferase [Psychroflexus sediminis]